MKKLLFALLLISPLTYTQIPSFHYEQELNFMAQFPDEYTDLEKELLCNHVGIWLSQTIKHIQEKDISHQEALYMAHIALTAAKISITLD